jgi:ABC-type phosphate/phosphonate transport system substrate-binding protein
MELTGPGPSARVASLPMYDFRVLRGAHDRLWAAIAAELCALGINAPHELTHADDVHSLWHDPALFLSQSCGWPLVMELRDRVSVIGTFAYDVPENGDGYYRSVLVAASPAPLEALATATAAVNSFDSLSGWISLRAALGGDDQSRAVVLTGSHLASLATLREGRAAVAAIDAVTYALIARDEPGLLEGTFVVGSGPRVPCLPIIGPGSWDDGTLSVVRAAIDSAIGGPGLAAVRSALLIRGLVPLDARDYASVLELVPSAR